MKTYLVARREELKKRQNKGFTLMEMLIVVAIIAILIAIAVPVFTTQLERSREATDLSNIRAAYAEATAEYLATGASAAKSATASAVQTKDGWDIGDDQAKLHTRVNGNESSVAITAKTSGVYTVTVSADGTVTVS